MVELERHDQHIKSLQHQVDEVKADVSDIHRLATAVEVIAINTKNTDEKVCRIDNRLKAIESEPLKELKDYRGAIVKAVITGVAGAIIGALMTLIVR